MKKFQRSMIAVLTAAIMITGMPQNVLAEEHELLAPIEREEISTQQISGTETEGTYGEVSAPRYEGALLKDVGKENIAFVESYPIAMKGNATSRFAAANWRYSAKTPEVVGFFDYKGCYNVVYSVKEEDTLKVVIQRYNAKMQLEKSFEVSSTYPLFGNAICDDAGNYYIVTGQSDSENKNCVTICVLKYDYQGKKLGSCEIKGYEMWDDYWGTQIPFRSGNCDLVINNGILACHFSRQMYSGHQSDYTVYVNCSDMKRVTNLYEPYNSHSFDQRVIALSNGGFLEVSHSDAYPRGFCIAYIDTEGRGYETVNFHFREGSDRSYGYNETYAQLGGIAETAHTYAFLGSSERTLSVETAPTTADYCGNSEARDLFIQFLKKDFYNYSGTEQYYVKGETRKAVGKKPESALTKLWLNGNEVDYGIIWLTDYTDDYYVNNPKVTAIENNRLLVMWEKLAYSTHEGSAYYAILNENGTVYKEPMEILNLSLAGNTDVSYKNGKVYWTTKESDSETGYIHVLDTSKTMTSVTKLTLNQTDMKLKIGESQTLIAEIAPSNASNKKLTYVSSDESVVTVDENGKVTGVNGGTAVIKVTANGGKDVYTECSVEVAYQVVNIYLDYEEKTICIGDTFQLSASVYPQNAGDKSLSYTSSDSKIASVDENGIVTGISEGTAVITAKTKDGSNVTDTCKITVTDRKVTKLEFEKYYLELQIGQKEQVSVTVYPSNATNKEVIYSSSDSKVATVDQEGVITAVAEGTAVIIAKAADGSDITDRRRVYVVKQNVENNNTENNTEDDWKENVEQAELRFEDGKWLYYENGVFNHQKYGFVEFEGGIFLVANGVLASEINGLAADPNSSDWYYLASGQVQTQYTGLAQYDGAWFYINAGRLDTALAGYVEYDGGLFYVAAGQIKKEVNGLAADPNTGKWYFLAEGQAQLQYTGLAQYDGAWFYVVNGALAENYTGNVNYDGNTFFVVNGKLQ